MSQELPPPAERRPKPRKKVLLGGVVTYSEGAFSCNCTIRNLSDSGALIALPTGLSLPSTVYLVNLHGHTAYEAGVEWHKGARAGLSFAASFDLNVLTDPSLAYLRHIWKARVPF